MIRIRSAVCHQAPTGVVRGGSRSLDAGKGVVVMKMSRIGKKAIVAGVSAQPSAADLRQTADCMPRPMLGDVLYRGTAPRTLLAGLIVLPRR